jgi:hypothetical protein
MFKEIRSKKVFDIESLRFPAASLRLTTLRIFRFDISIYKNMYQKLPLSVQVSDPDPGPGVPLFFLTRLLKAVIALEGHSLCILFMNHTGI